MTARVGLVVVSHSAPLADAAVELAMEMAGDDPPAVATAAGTEDGGFGTDANKVLEAVEEVGSEAGVLVLMDLGSAVLSAEMALEFMPDVEGEVRLTSAPMVEGLTSAVVSAAMGADLDTVEREARNGLAGKRDHLGDAQDAADAGETIAEQASGDGYSFELELVNPDGLHARPAARLASAAGRASGSVTVENLTDGRGPVDARSVSSIATLGAAGGDIVRITASGPDGDEVLEDLRKLVEDGFGELSGQDGGGEKGASVEQATSAAGHASGVSPGRGAGPVVRLRVEEVEEPEVGDVVPDDERDAAVDRLRAAAAAAADALREQAVGASETVRDVLEATAGMAEDPAVLDAATERVRDDGRTPERAVWEAFEALIEQFREGGELLEARVVDVRDVRERVVRQLVGAEDDRGPTLPDDGPAVVLVTVELRPAAAARLTAERCAAIVTARGGPTSHAAIIARSLGIPAVFGYGDLDALEDGQVVVVDGTHGEVDVEPDDAAVVDASGTR